jgi:uncharacterized protein YybS (DUF2232 family)
MQFIKPSLNALVKATSGMFYYVIIAAPKWNLAYICCTTLLSCLYVVSFFGSVTRFFQIRWQKMTKTHQTVSRLPASQFHIPQSLVWLVRPVFSFYVLIPGKTSRKVVIHFNDIIS